jgi:NAD(P)-dependent dehydrogenase (short-subunit alcohol dehydrogenase family)
MRNIIIFGTNRGIGLALVKKYISNGDQVWATCRNNSEELSNSKATVIENVDVTDLIRLKQVSKKLSDVKFDVLIHNSGIWTDEDIFNSTESDFKEMQRGFEVNSIAPLKVVSQFSKHLHDGGKIGLLSSRMGSINDNTSGGRYSYRMSKCALNAAGKSLSLDLPENPIAILHPGYVKTDMTNNNGLIDTTESAQGLFNVMEKLNKESTGNFWHTNGERLSW